jgi:hypothetical protein
MKIMYNIFYALSIITVFLALTGGSLSSGLFTSISEATLEYSGVQKAKIESADDKIDDIMHSAKKVELQIEKLKNLFSQDNIDESKYQKTKNYFITNTFYNPLVELFNYIYRVFFLFGGIFFFMFGVVAHLIIRSMDLRRRVRELEFIVLNQRKG